MLSTTLKRMLDRFKIRKGIPLIVNHELDQLRNEIRFKEDLDLCSDVKLRHQDTYGIYKGWVYEFEKDEIDKQSCYSTYTIKLPIEGWNMPIYVFYDK